jgi:hypothetical protein
MPTTQAFTQDSRQQHDQYEAVCGLVACLTASVASSRRTCRCCAVLLRARPTPHLPRDTRPSHHQLGWLSPIFGSHTQGVNA